MKYTDEEKERILDYVLALTNEELGEFFAAREVVGARTKAQYRELLQELLSKGKLTYRDLTAHLDEVAPDGSQHVFLLNGPEGLARKWRDANWVAPLLKENHVDERVETRLSLILPDVLTLSKITYGPSTLHILAIARREGQFRDKELDFHKKVEGETIEYHAYRERVLRGLVILDWNLIQNTATLHVTQLPSGGSYDAERMAMAKLVHPWLDLSAFAIVDIEKGIKELHKLAEAGTPEARPQAIDYKTPGGRTYGGKGASTQTSMLGETITDTAMKSLREKGVAHIGNFWWLPTTGGEVAEETHVFLNAPDNRVNFTTRNPQRTIDHVLARVRHHCK